MRITNKMMTNNMMANINNNKNLLSLLDEQYSTGKKIQRPSQDPIVAVRALKLRTNLAELTQYYEKNIPDARSWMDVTESALKNVNTILTNVNTYCVQGATDSLTPDDRTSIAETLQELKEQIYQEGNSNYAGRYVFTGYKTDSGLVFDDDTTSLTYDITEHFTGEDIDAISTVLSDKNVGDPIADGDTPTVNNTHRLRLSYDNLVSSTFSTLTIDSVTYTVNNISSSDPTAYTPDADEINFIPETGELVFGDNVYAAVESSDDISVTYQKNDFKEGDLKPENYFECSVNDGTNTVNYTPTDQEIQYEINFNQKLTVNTQAKDSITHDIGRDIDEILASIKDVETVEGKISEVKKKLEDGSLTDSEIDDLNKSLDYFQTELTLKSDVMRDKFEKGISGSEDSQQTINVAIADLGSRYVRLDLTEDRLSSQQVDFEDLMSNNEDADVAETYIKLSSAETIYTASLNAASNVVRSNLLDFL